MSNIASRLLGKVGVVLRDGQGSAVQALALSERDVFLCLQTGAGKTLVFALSLLGIFKRSKCARALGFLVVPTNALMRGHADSLIAMGAFDVYLLKDAAAVKDLAAQALTNARKEGAKPLVVIGGPELFVMALPMILMSRNLVALVGVDEAHLIHAWSTFRPDFTKLSELVKAAKGARVMAMSASASQADRKSLMGLLGVSNHVDVVRHSHRREIKLSFHEVGAGEVKQKPYQLAVSLALDKSGGLGLVFAATYQRVESVAAQVEKALRDRNWRGWVGTYSGQQESHEQARAISLFTNAASSMVDVSLYNVSPGEGRTRILRTARLPRVLPIRVGDRVMLGNSSCVVTSVVGNDTLGTDDLTLENLADEELEHLLDQPRSVSIELDGPVGGILVHTTGLAFGVDIKGGTVSRPKYIHIYLPTTPRSTQCGLQCPRPAQIHCQSSLCALAPAANLGPGGRT